MKRVLKWLSGAVALAVMALALLFVQVWYFKPLKIDWFYTRIFAEFALQSPEMLSSMRVLPSWLDFHSDKLDDASPAQELAMADLVTRDLRTLHEYDRADLDRGGQLSYDVLEYFLASMAEGKAYREHDFPLNQMFGVQSSLPDFMAQTHPISSQRDADNYVARLRLFPRKFSQVLEGLEAREAKQMIPPQFTVEKVLLQMREFVAPAPVDNMLYTTFVEKLDKLAPGTIDDRQRARLLADVESSIAGQVYPAYAELIAHFDALQPKAQGNFGAWHLPDGAAYYEWCVRMHTTTTMTPQQVHELGLAEVARISAGMDVILRERGLDEGSVGERVQHLARQPEQMYPNTEAGKAAMIAQYQAILDEINADLTESFNVRPKLGVLVKPIPEFSEKTAPGAYYQGGALDGSRPGVFFANMREPSENPKFSMRTLAYHEGIPGHHFQITIAQELQGVPFFRRVLPFTAYSEGWALYAEQLAWELGFQDDPLDNLGRLSAEMMRAVRLVVDSGIHFKRWTREQAIDYMMDNTGMGETDVVAEIERYFVAPGQALAYKVGMLKILALREKAQQALGERFRLADFHDQILTHGALPMTLLERVVDDWISAGGGAGKPAG